jgi:hypothetical protein
LILSFILQTRNFSGFQSNVAHRWHPGRGLSLHLARQLSSVLAFEKTRDTRAPLAILTWGAGNGRHIYDSHL